MEVTWANTPTHVPNIPALVLMQVPKLRYNLWKRSLTWNCDQDAIAMPHGFDLRQVDARNGVFSPDLRWYSRSRAKMKERNVTGNINMRESFVNGVVDKPGAQSYDPKNARTFIYIRTQSRVI